MKRSEKSYRDRILEAVKTSQDKNGNAIVAQVAMKVYGKDNRRNRMNLSRVLDAMGIKRKRLMTQSRAIAMKLEKKPAVISLNPEPAETDLLDVELYLAIKAKAGSAKAFKLLQMLV